MWLYLVNQSKTETLKQRERCLKQETKHIGCYEAAVEIVWSR
jgi:hypothetical protein